MIHMVTSLLTVGWKKDVFDFLSRNTAFSFDHEVKCVERYLSLFYFSPIYICVSCTVETRTPRTVKKRGWLTFVILWSPTIPFPMCLFVLSPLFLFYANECHRSTRNCIFRSDDCSQSFPIRIHWKPVFGSTKLKRLQRRLWIIKLTSGDARLMIIIHRNIPKMILKKLNFLLLSDIKQT